MAIEKKYVETPLMKQYYAVKAVHPDAILLFRVGDFYETFGDDAIKASGILGITLTRRANGAATFVELAGFPYHAIDTYLPKLVRAGERVAICEQLEDPKQVKGLVKRGVIELVTPGVVLGDNIFAGHGLKKRLKAAVKNAETGKGATVFGYYVDDPERFGIVEFNKNGKAVSIEYSDRYLKTPLGCMLLAKMISSLKNEADLVLVSIKVIVTNIVSINDSDVAVNAIKDFANGKKRNHFLKDAIFELTGIEPEIQDTGYVEHERCLTVKADNAEVCIRPDAGIAKGWAPFGRDNAECTDRDFREDWNIDLELFNKQQIGNGILYTISYKQL